MPQVTLYRPYDRFCRETTRLLSVFHDAMQGLSSASLSDSICRYSGEMAVIRLYDGWARFCRELVLLSATGKPFTANGAQLPRCAAAKTTHIALSLLTNGGKRYEPEWAKSKSCLDAAKLLGVHNYLTVANAVGSQQSPIEEIRVIRNFFAHRSKRTADEIRGRNLSRHTSFRIEHLAGAIVTPSTLRLESWVIDLRHIALAAIQ